MSNKKMVDKLDIQTAIMLLQGKRAYNSQAQDRDEELVQCCGQSSTGLV
jgi:hypothetical protein